MRFETPPGPHSQIDWGQALVPFRAGPAVGHVFVLPVGFSRRGFYDACADERLVPFREAHEQTFGHFGGPTQEPRDEHPRTVGYADEPGRRRWTSPVKAFAASWGLEPRVCRPYRAQTTGKVESGVKYGQRNVLPGRTFVDRVDFQAQLDEWTAPITACTGCPLRSRWSALSEHASTSFHERARVASCRRRGSHGSWPTTSGSVWRRTARPFPFASSGGGSRCNGGGTRSPSFTATRRSRCPQGSQASTNSGSYPSTVRGRSRASRVSVGPL